MSSRFLKIPALIIAFFLVVGISAYFTLTLIIKSENTVVVPDLIGKDAVQVLEILTNMGLNTRILESEFSSDQPKDHIIFQEPGPGSEIKKGRDVRVIVSKGAQAIIAPDLVGLTGRRARILLTDRGLCPGVQSFTHADMSQKGQILAQIPPAGTTMKRGECIAFLLSLGKLPRAIMMPDLKGLTPDDAIIEIEMNNLILGDIDAYYQDNVPIDTIVGQKPLPGHRVVEGMTVHLVRNRQPQKKNPGHMNANATGRLFRYRSKDGFINRRIRIHLKGFGLSVDLFRGFVKPGEEIWRIIPQKENVTVSLYEDGKLIPNPIYDTWPTIIRVDELRRFGL